MKRRNFLNNTLRLMLLGGLVTGVSGFRLQTSGFRKEDEACSLKCRNCPACNTCRRLKPEVRSLKPEALQETIE